MARLFLLIAGLCKIARAIGLKFTGCLARFFTNNRRSRRYGGQYWFLGLALKSLPVGTACGPDADRHLKYLIQLILEGSCVRADLRPWMPSIDFRLSNASCK